MGVAEVVTVLRAMVTTSRTVVVRTIMIVIMGGGK